MPTTRWTRAARLALALAATSASAATAADRLTVPVEYTTLDNGLKVVLSPDRTSPTAVVAVYYNIGFRPTTSTGTSRTSTPRRSTT